MPIAYSLKSQPSLNPSLAFMSNNYTQFSVALEMPTAESVKYALALKSRLDDARGEELPELPDIPEVFHGYIQEWGGFHCEDQTIGGKHSLWISHGDESGDPEAAALFISHLLRKFHPGGCFELTWANWCSKPRLEEFSGGAAFITGETIEYFNMANWLAEQTERWLKQKPE